MSNGHISMFDIQHLLSKECEQFYIQHTLLSKGDPDILFPTSEHSLCPLSWEMQKCFLYVRRDYFLCHRKCRNVSYMSEEITSSVIGNAEIFPICQKRLLHPSQEMQGCVLYVRRNYFLRQRECRDISYLSGEMISSCVGDPGDRLPQESLDPGDLPPYESRDPGLLESRDPGLTPYESRPKKYQNQLEYVTY